MKRSRYESKRLRRQLRGAQSRLVEAQAGLAAEHAKVEELSRTLRWKRQVARFRRSEADAAQERLAQFQEELNAWDEDVVRMLGEFTAFRFTPPKKESPHAGRGEAITVPVGSVPQPHLLLRSDISIGDLKARVTEMRRVLVTLSAEKRERLMMRVRAEFGGRQGVYDLYTGPNDDPLAQAFGARDAVFIARNLAQMLREFFNSGGGHDF